jgi:poly-gamma-glutamate synthesis protein (capsule biosynthesis protein)
MNKARSFLLLFALILIAFSCKYSKPITPSPDNSDILNETEEKIPRYTLTLLATGDNLFHETIINSFRHGGSYNFTPIYSEVKNLVEKADVAFINQETVMAGESFGYTGYPAFNTPHHLARNLADTGFDIVNHANNHAMDMGRDGLYATLDMWDTMQEITVIGARKAGDKHRVIAKNNITLGFLSYTYGLNGIALPRDNPNLVSLINRTKMEEEIKALRPLCDFLIVSMHWGEEYQMEPSAEQKNLALFLAELDTDLIIGHHPHVLQRAEKLPRPGGKETLCFYSLGNFVSNQREKERILGAMMLVTFLKQGDELSISDSGLLPVVCHFERNFTNTKVYPLYSYTEELLEKHLLHQRDKGMDYGFFNSVLFNLNAKLIMHNPF